jgi:tetratricopeptide (TPR) repeat protein
MENPSAVAQVPPKLAKDYAKFWTRFLAANDDPKLEKDLDNLLKKQKMFDPALVIEGYIRLYARDDAAARQKFSQALAINSKNRIALYYLAEIAYAHQEYAAASTLYDQLLSMDSTHADIATKRQRALLLATDEVLRSGARAEGENRLADAEQAYRQVLKALPNDASLHQRLADLLTRENKLSDAQKERQIAEELSPRRVNVPKPAGSGVAANTETDTLDDLGRWGGDLNRFHEIRNETSLTREQLAVLLVRYFPQLTELRQTRQIVTDIQNSWASSEIQIILGLGLIDAFPNHTFEPAARVDRGTLARTMARVMRLLRVSQATSASIPAPDLQPADALYPEAQLVLGSGVMMVQDSGQFNVSGPVSGREAVNTAERLLRVFQQAPR